ncbi:uncharacterized protein LOC129241753 [Anastrepha obliqua]|uniref:uncharacterized protein LOC129241753 n=1 Tax=Anastrepha obliqua TaxID=95512 RepID=UPI00240A9590|nr:uncharacterized protein LOC129241753 [Anastrepha obliqua]
MTPQAKADVNARLCRAVQQHRCIYDRSDENYERRDAYDLAWNEIAKTCDESVISCKLRWRNIRTAFIRSVVGLPKKRKGHRTKEYYLQDVLEFFKPHIFIGSEVRRFHDPSDDETESVSTRRSTISGNNTKANGIKTEVSSEIEIEDNEEEVVTQKQELKSKVKNKSHAEETTGGKNNEVMKRNEEKGDDDIKSNKRPPSARREALKKHNESIKNEEHKADATKSNRKSQPAKSKAGEKIEIVEKNAPKADQTKLNKKTRLTNNKVGTFYISPTNSDTGTFFIRKNDCNSNAENASKSKKVIVSKEVNRTDTINFKVESTEKRQIENTEELDEAEELVTNEQNEHRFRFKRACKRNLDKTMISQLRLRQREPEVKRSRRSVERRKSLAKATLQLAESIEWPKKETKLIQVQPKPTPSLQTSQVDMPEIIMESPPTNAAANSKSEISTTLTDSLVSVGSTDNSVMGAITCEPDNAESSIDQGVQCNLQPVSTDDDFLSTLKPYLKDMNARQKLHFKKKIFESLMEVFDSAVDFPGLNKSHGAAAPSAIIPPQLTSVSGEELNLVRELVAVVQAAKHTPELSVNTSNSSEKTTEMIEEERPLVSPALPLPPPPLTLRTVPTTHSAVLNTSAKSLKLAKTLKASNIATSHAFTPPLSVITPTLAAPTTLAAVRTAGAPPLVQRRIIRKLVKVNDQQGSSGIATSSTANTQIKNDSPRQRTIYQIFPKNVTSNASFKHTISSSGVSTFTVPRTMNTATNNGPPRNKVVTIAATPPITGAPSTTQNFRPFVVPAMNTMESWTPASIASSLNTTNTTNRVPDATGVRPIMRRFSLCGDVPLRSLERHSSTKVLTTTATVNLVPSALKSATTAARGWSMSNVNAVDPLKLPTSLRTTCTNVTAATNTTSSRTMPVLSVASADRNAPASSNFWPPAGLQETALPFKQTVCNNSSTPCVSSAFSNFSTISPISTISRVCPDAEKRITNESGGVDMAGIIASDSFAFLNIKSEPIDDSY